MKNLNLWAGLFLLVTQTLSHEFTATPGKPRAHKVLEKQVDDNKFFGRVVYEDEHDYDDPILDIGQETETAENNYTKMTGKSKSRLLKSSIEELTGAQFEEVDLEKLDKGKQSFKARPKT